MACHVGHATFNYRRLWGMEVTSPGNAPARSLITFYTITTYIFISLIIPIDLEEKKKKKSSKLLCWGNTMQQLREDKIMGTNACMSFPVTSLYLVNSCENWRPRFHCYSSLRSTGYLALEKLYISALW